MLKKLEFNQISQSGLKFETKSDEVKLYGLLKKKSLNLVSCEAKLSGKFDHYCDRCGIEFVLSLDEDVNLILSNGFYKDSNLDAMEFFDGFIDVDEILQSELQAYLSEYHYCDKCKI